MSNDVNKFIAGLKSLVLDVHLMPHYNEIGEILVRSIDRNFR